MDEGHGVASRASLFLLPIIYLGYISLGLPDGTFGVAWPAMHLSLKVPVGAAGGIAFIIPLLAAVSSFNSGRIIARFKTGPVVLISCTLTASGLLLTSHAQGLGWLIVATLPLALGAGAVDSGLNGYVARHYSGRHMNWLHACWGVGATCGPVIMTQALQTAWGWRGGYLLLGSIQIALAVVFLASLRLWDDHATATAEARSVPRESHEPDRTPTTHANSVAGFLSAAVFAVYVAIETTAGVWAATLLVVGRDLPQSSAGICVSLYYASITTGRIIVGFFVDRWGNRRLISLGLALALAGGALFTQAHSLLATAPSLVLLGLGFAPVYPCMMHEAPRRFAPEAVVTVIGRQSGAAYIGGAFLPAGVGWLIGHAPLSAIAWIVLGGTVLLGLVIRQLNRLT